jgi:tRNA (guanine10-N2)-dimethyltransferase
VKLLLELSMECESLARSEAVAAMRALGDAPRVLDEDLGVMVVESGADPKALAARLALCHNVDEWMTSCTPGDLESCAEQMDVPGPIKVSSTKVGIREADLTGTNRRVGAILGKTRGVDIHDPRSEVRIVFSDRVHAGRKLASVDRASYEKRKNRYMPYVYPASLHPKFSRAAVNLTQVGEGGRLLDPFCGTGAIVAEAALAGLEAIGSDLSDKMVEGARKNLAHINVGATVHECDVGDIRSVVGKVDGIATDPPYGRSSSTRGERIPELYRRAYAAIADVLSPGARLVAVLPDDKSIESADGFRMLESHRLWVHNSLTRHFFVLERR